MNALEFINESRTYLKIKKFKISVPEELQLLILRNWYFTLQIKADKTDLMQFSWPGT